MFMDSKDLMDEVAMNSRFALESEMELRDKLRALEQPWYSKIIKMFYISIPIIGGITLVIIMLKCGIKALMIEILISCLTQCCRLGCRAKKLINETGLGHCEDDNKQYNSNISISGFFFINLT